MEFRWEEVFHIWSLFALYLICFFIHNFFLAPLLLQKRWKSYIPMTLCLLIAFVVISGFKHSLDPPMGKREPPEWMRKEKDNRNFREKDHRHKDHRRPLADQLFGHEVPVNILILIGLLGLNLGVKLYFKSEQDRTNLQQLEKEKMYLQLQYLKFQINPHFFMNTLNNIQVLIDMDAEAAKGSLRELSISIPPLIFPTFVENAFKHGVSYSQNSFITVMMDVEEGRLIFCCYNSKRKKKEQTITKQVSGVGLKNVKRRLDLIYGENYSLEIKDGESTYKVLLSLPITNLPLINNTTRE